LIVNIKVIKILVVEINTDPLLPKKQPPNPEYNDPSSGRNTIVKKNI